MNADELLARAKTVYRACDGQYRDGLLEVGGWLHEFVLARLKEGDALNEANRLKRGITRRAAVEEAAAAIDTTAADINRLVATWAVADLLGKGGLGTLGHCAVYRFRCFVRRRRGTRQDVAGHHAGAHQLSNEETWEVKPEFAGEAEALFRRAVAEGWSQHRAASEAARLFAKALSSWGRHKQGPKAASENEPHPDRRAAAKLASPGDVAEMCLELVNASADPWAVAQRLLPELAKVKRPRRQSCA